MADAASIISAVDIPSAELARRLKISDGHVADLKSGRRRPSLKLARRLEEETGCGGIVAAVVAAKVEAA